MRSTRAKTESSVMVIRSPGVCMTSASGLGSKAAVPAISSGVSRVAGCRGRSSPSATACSRQTPA
ncbi:hypothetical protein ACFQZC_15215 [Streptacidiphilus monticola]